MRAWVYGESAAHAVADAWWDGKPTLETVLFPWPSNSPIAYWDNPADLIAQSELAVSYTSEVTPDELTIGLSAAPKRLTPETSAIQTVSASDLLKEKDGDAPAQPVTVVTPN
jgi:hypothetical protein